MDSLCCALLADSCAACILVGGDLLLVLDARCTIDGNATVVPSTGSIDVLGSLGDESSSSFVSATRIEGKSSGGQYP